MKRSYRHASLLAMLLSFLLPLSLFANPSGGTVTSGSASIYQTGNAMTITQASNQAIINWNSFSINPSESVQFLQPSSLSATLNRVMGIDPSIIQGSLKANGQIFLINPNGILFGSSAVVDVAGLVATTLSISDQNFLSGNYTFSQDTTKPLASIVNQGFLQAAPEGTIALIAPLVDNEGTIVATLGQVRLGAGTQAVLNTDGKGYVNFVVSSNQIPQNVTLTQSGLTNLLQQAINNSNIVEAGSVTTQNGIVTLGKSEGVLINNGTISATGSDFQQGGSVILNSGQTTYLGSNSLINVSGSGIRSNAGDIHVLSNGNTLLDSGSQLQARGGTTGDGGFIESSAKNNFLTYGTVNTSAANGNIGTYLIDPTTITITNDGGTLNADLPSILFATPNSGINSVRASVLEAQLSNVTLQATNSITINSITGGNIPMSNNVSLDMETQTGNITFVNTANTITTSGTGSITIHAGENLGSGGQAILGNLTTSGTGTISVLADGNISFGTLTSGNAVTLNSANGAVTAIGATQVIAPSITVTANTGIGTAITPLGTSASSSLTATTNALVAPIYLNNNIALANLSITTQNSTANVQINGGNSLSFNSGTSTLTGNITGTNLTLDNTAGNLLLNGLITGASSATLTASGSIASGGGVENLTAGNATLNAGTNIGTAGTPLTTALSGTLNANTTNGLVNLANSAGTLTVGNISSSGAGNNVTLSNSGGNILIGQINSSGGIFLTSTSGSLLDHTGNSETNLMAQGNSTLTSQSVIGILSDPLLVQIQGTLGVTSSGIQTGNSVNINGSVTSGNTLNLLNTPSGSVLFNGVNLNPPSSSTNFNTSSGTSIATPVVLPPVSTLIAEFTPLTPALTFQGSLQTTLINEFTDSLQMDEPTHQTTGCHGSVESFTIRFISIYNTLTKSGQPCP